MPLGFEGQTGGESPHKLPRSPVGWLGARPSGALASTPVIPTTSRVLAVVKNVNKLPRWNGPSSRSCLHHPCSWRQAPRGSPDRSPNNMPPGHRILDRLRWATLRKTLGALRASQSQTQIKQTAPPSTPLMSMGFEPEASTGSHRAAQPALGLSPTQGTFTASGYVAACKSRCQHPRASRVHTRIYVAAQSVSQ